MNLFDTHSHLLPGVDDGCENVEQSLETARILVAAGYGRAFCTPHNWPNLGHYNNPPDIARRTELLQRQLDRAAIPLRLYPGAELYLSDNWDQLPADKLITYNLAGRYCIFDFWEETVPAHFESAVRALQARGLKVILAHPERLPSIQKSIQKSRGAASNGPTEMMDWMASLGLLFQGNLQCFGEPPEKPNRQLAERFLAQGRYFMLGSDSHNPQSMPIRLAGLERVRQAVDAEKVRELMVDHPEMLLGNL